MRALALVSMLIIVAAGSVQAQEPICGVAFITSERTSLPIASCTLSEINEDGSRGAVIHRYDDVNPDGNERIDFTASVFRDLVAAGTYDLYCIDVMEQESLPSSGEWVCPRPGTPKIESD